MATMSNGNGSTMQINSRPDDIRKRIIGSDDSAQGDTTTCGNILVVLSWIIVIITMPFSLFVCFKVVQEYEGPSYSGWGVFYLAVLRVPVRLKTISRYINLFILR
ncbi:band 7 protein AAEL010189-like [Ooceraea biroi]|nr:band 7 protein AAEL010189-like [Ooceraea biroi]